MPKDWSKRRVGGENMAEKQEKKGICGKCPIGVGKPACAVCAVLALAFVYNIVR